MTTNDGRPDFDDVLDVLEHIRETSDAVFIQPQNEAASRFLWGHDNGIFLLKPGQCNYVGRDAVRRYESLLEADVELSWRDYSEQGVMDEHDEQVREAVTNV